MKKITLDTQTNFAISITLEDAAEKVGLSATYFSKKFRKVTGINFKEYLNKIRLSQACRQLITTNDSITKIAIECGFNSSNYFKDIFRKTYGKSPRTFRSEAQKQFEGDVIAVVDDQYSM